MCNFTSPCPLSIIPFCSIPGVFFSWKTLLLETRITEERSVFTSYIIHTPRAWSLPLSYIRGPSTFSGLVLESASSLRHHCPLQCKESAETKTGSSVGVGSMIFLKWNTGVKGKGGGWCRLTHWKRFKKMNHHQQCNMRPKSKNY